MAGKLEIRHTRLFAQNACYKDFTEFISHNNRTPVTETWRQVRPASLDN